MVTQPTIQDARDPQAFSARTPTQRQPAQSSEPTQEHAQTPVYPSAIDDVDILLSYNLEQLDALYREALCPPIEALDGQGKGRMLAVTGWGSRFPLHMLLRRLAGSHYFPWKGKNFTPLNATQGEGINRTLSGRWPLHLFSFDTSIDVSLWDDKPAFVLDYDITGNPGLIRRIRDEIRQISPHVFLGQAWIRTHTHHFALYFALSL